MAQEPGRRRGAGIRRAAGTDGAGHPCCPQPGQRVARPAERPARRTVPGAADRADHQRHAAAVEPGWAWAARRAYSVVATATDYLPEALQSYLRLPRDWADTRPIDGPKTALMVLIEALEAPRRDDGPDPRRRQPSRRAGPDRAQPLPRRQVRPLLRWP
ncbi:hypothetical protein G5V59_24920 [Nocardioides sp. W3-2-3]|nr:hypothetical protein [Nocardioides convexus]